MAPELEFVFELLAEVAPPIELGETPAGMRRIVPILSGSFEGPEIRGTILSGGADWQVVRTDGVSELHAQYMLATDDGVPILARIRGLRHGKGDALKRIAAGEIVDPSEYYFRTSPVFEAPAGRYAWLNRSIFVAVGERTAAAVRVRTYRVL